LASVPDTTSSASSTSGSTAADTPALPESASPENSVVTEFDDVELQDERAIIANLQRDIEQYRQQMAEPGNADGLFSQTLREQLEALASLLQQIGDHEGAITELENAMHIERVNEGLFTLEQIPLVQKLIASH